MNPASRRTFLQALLSLVPVALLPTAARDQNTRTSGAPRPPAADAPPFDAAALRRWQTAPRTPVVASEDPLVSRLLAAARTSGTLDVIYYGGSFPGTVRRLTPLAVFSVKGFSGVWLEARCDGRRGVRTFNTARLSFEPLRIE